MRPPYLRRKDLDEPAVPPLANSVANRVGSPSFFILGVLLVLIWAATGPIFHFSDTWQLVINTGTTIVTFLISMPFGADPSRYLSASAGSFMAMGVVHRLATKLRPTRHGNLATGRHWPTITFSDVESVVDMPIEMIRPVEPRPRANEYTALEPLRPILAVRRAAVWGRFVVSVRANRGATADSYRYPRRATADKENTKPDGQNTQPS
jgi:Low affinity iron permease